MGRDSGERQAIDLSRTLFVSDLDGTLLNRERVISSRSRKLLNEAIERGAQFTIATARTPATVDSLLEGINMRLPAIVMTGGAYWRTDIKQYVDPIFFTPEEARTIFDTYKRNGVPVFAYTLMGQHLEIFHFGEMNPVERGFMEERMFSPFKHFNLGMEDIPEECLGRVMLFYGMQPDYLAAPVYEELQPLKMNPLFYHDMFGPEIAIMETFPYATTKANAIEHLAREICAENIVVFGDNINDLSMFDIATHRVAVRNAIPEVKREADVILAPNHTNSVARYIHSFTL